MPRPTRTHLWPLGAALCLLPSVAFAQSGGGGEIPGGIPQKPPVPQGKIQTDTQNNAPTSSLMTAIEAYEAWLHRFDHRFADIEERVAKSSKALDALEFDVLGDTGERADAVVFHDAQPGSYFVLEEIRYVLDGLPVATRLDSPGQPGKNESFEIFSGRFVPGQHVLAVEMIFRVRGYELLSSEMKSKRFHAKGSFTFEAKNGVISRIEVLGKDTVSQSPAAQNARQLEKRFAVTFALTERARPS